VVIGVVAWFGFGGEASRRPTLVKNVFPGPAEPAVPAVAMMRHERADGRERPIGSVPKSSLFGRRRLNRIVRAVRSSGLGWLAESMVVPRIRVSTTFRPNQDD